MPYRQQTLSTSRPWSYPLAAPYSKRSSPQSRFFSGTAAVSGGRAIPNNDFLGIQSEVTRFHIAMLANDHVKQGHAGLFTFDPIGRIEERCTAMLADPSHARKFSNGSAIAIRRTVHSAEGSIWKFKGILSRLCGGQDVYENRCRY
jgi:hypothetical protein